MLKSAPNTQYLQFCSFSMAGSFYANQKLFLLRKARAVILLKGLKVEKKY
jgi:hypothetical protein